MAYQCGICGTSIEKIMGWCSMACKQVYEHERREDILKMLPWEITVEAYKFKDKGYSRLYTVLLEIVQEPDNWIKQHRLIRIIRYCRSKKIPIGKLEMTYHLLKQAEAPHYNQKAGQIWGREFLLQPDLEMSNVNNDKIGLLGINSSFYVGVSKNDKGTNERYQVGNSCTIQGSNANLSNQFTRELREQMAKESIEMRDTQLITMFWSIVIVAAVLAAVVSLGQSLWAAIGGTAGLTASSAAVSAISAGAVAAVKMGGIYLAFVTGFNWLSTVNPGLAAYASMAFDSIDALVSFVTMSVCWWMDVPIHLFNPSFDSIMLIGPLVFGAYSSTFDLVGTLPRWLTINHMNKFYPDQGDFRHVIFENYELAMMTGQYYDFFGKYSSDLGCGPAWFG